MQAINDYVVLTKIKEAPKKIAGLEVTESQNNELRYLKGQVVSVGNLIPADLLSKDNIVKYDKHAGHSISEGDNLHIVLKIGDIVGVE